MTGAMTKVPNADVCAFSQVEAEVLRRVREGGTINAISAEVGLAEPIVMEYIRSMLGKVRARDIERMTGSENAGTMLKQDLFTGLLGGTAIAPQA